MIHLDDLEPGMFVIARELASDAPPFSDPVLAYIEWQKSMREDRPPTGVPMRIVAVSHPFISVEVPVKKHDPSLIGAMLFGSSIAAAGGEKGDGYKQLVKSHIIDASRIELFRVDEQFALAYFPSGMPAVGKQEVR